MTVGPQRKEIPGQLPMFMTAREIKEGYQPDTYGRLPGSATRHGGPERSEEVWYRKLRESKYPEDEGPSLHESIAAEGVHVPLHLSLQFGSEGKRVVVEGQHRLAAQHDID